MKIRFFLIFLIGIHSMQGWTATTRHGVTRKRRTVDINILITSRTGDRKIKKSISITVDLPQEKGIRTS